MLLARYVNCVVPNDMLLHTIWGHENYSDLRVLHTHVSNLRKKIETPTHRYIKAEYRVGLRLIAE